MAHISINSLGTYITYIHHDRSYNSRLAPANPTNDTKGNIFFSEASQASYNTSSCEPQGAVVTKIGWTNLINDHHDMAVGIADDLENLIDQGNTSYYLDVVHNAHNDPPGAYNELMGVTPYLSLEVLLAMVQKEEFDAEMLRNILILNTDGLKDPLIWEYLVGKPGIDPYIDELITARSTMSDKENMQANYAYHLTEKYNAVEGLASWHINNPDSEPVYDALVALYGAQPTAQYQYRKAANQFISGDFGGAESTLINMSGMGFSAEEMTYHDDYIDWLDVMDNFRAHDFVNDGTYMLSGNDQEVLDRILADDGHPLNANAMTFDDLRRFEGQLMQIPSVTEIKRIDPVHLPGYDYLKVAKAEAPVAYIPAEETSFNIRIFPNPSRSYFKVVTNSSLNGTATLYDLKGVKLSETVLVKGVGILNPPTNVAAGIYVIHAIDEGGNHTSEKVIIQK